MIDTNTLYYLIAVAKAKTLSKAAQELHLSQQALGRSMKKLEEQLQVPLFTRTKNKIELNEYGKMAVIYAKKVIGQLDEMETTIKELERKNRTIAIGSLAPRPLYDLYKIIATEFTSMRLETEIISDVDTLIKGLRQENYQIIILNKKIKADDLAYKLWGSEQLYFTLPLDHRLANQDKISFQDIDGETLILYQNIGFYQELVTSLMPNTHFIIENNRNNFLNLLNRSDFVSFTTDLAMEEEGKINNRSIKEISDFQSIVPFYCYCLKKNYHKFQNIFKNI
ncbi:LysR family transcriptional regulator [uncultured Thomasclavelia sp.]|uniref:LysR family transcriptional regulator n=1 Tax=uncultured Thomasclavelia sp. TaxID=3025759 RepID=UPI0025DEF555|nr:LysR family transcriptional regulator [uncultured Thomasclavelia sp.]